MKGCCSLNPRRMMILKKKPQPSIINDDSQPLVTRPLPNPKTKSLPKPTSKIIRLGPGDRVDITQLLFTKQRDFLIKSNSDQLVKAHHLQGKVIVLFIASVYEQEPGHGLCHLIEVYNDLYPYSPFEVVFVPLARPPCFPPSPEVKAHHLQGKVIVLFIASVYEQEPGHGLCHLIEVYNDLYHYSPFEVVFVPLARPPCFPPSPELYKQSPDQLFDSLFSTMPWTAIPYSDVASRKLIQATFGFDQRVFSDSPIIDPSGRVLRITGNDIFTYYGSAAYPFTKERRQFLDSQDYALLNRPSVTELLTTPQRDYLLSSNGVKVPVRSLENKVVALHFFEEDQPLYPSPDGQFVDITATLVAAYKDLVKKHDDFEVVLIYLHNSWSTVGLTSEDSFWKKFKTMPWLAVPFNDPVCKKLLRIFNYPLALDNADPDPDPRLVIVGPRGEFCERFAADIFMNDGTEAYPFTRKSAQVAGQII